MRILVVSSFLPYPLHSGGHVRLYNLILRLSKNHEITLVCEKRPLQRREDIEEVSKICKGIYTVERKKQWTLGNILKSGFSTNSFLITGHTNAQMKARLEELLGEENLPAGKAGFDLIHVETSYVFQNLPSGINIPIVLVEHNVEYMVYRKFVQNAPFVLRPLLYFDTLKLERAERSFWKKAIKLVAVSPGEAEIMSADAVVPNGVDTKKFKPSNGGERILFIGDFKWMQNRDSAEFLLKNIWPKVNVSEKLWIVGRKIPDNIKRLDMQNVIFDEDSPASTYEIYKRSKLLLAPIRIGGGTSFKILEAMASGVPVITTKLGNEGIGAIDGESILIAEKGEEFIRAINKLLEDKRLYGKIAKNARELIEENYDWDIIVAKLEKVYESAHKT